MTIRTSVRCAFPVSLLLAAVCLLPKSAVAQVPPTPDLESRPIDLTPALLTSDQERQAEWEEPAERFSIWLKEVGPLLLGKERLAFLRLRTNYQRDSFVEQFWRSRDPFPQTARNELRERYVQNLSLARSLYDSLEDDRARILLIHGEASSSFEVLCTKTRRPAEVWVYHRSAHLDFPFLLVFLRDRGLGPGRIWRPGDLTADDRISEMRTCINGEQLQAAVTAIRRSNDYDLTLRRILAKPRPRSEEWLDTFVAFSTDLASAAELLEGDLSVEFLGRYQSRTVTQGILQVPLSGVAQGELAGYRSYDLLLTGEVVSADRLFESFRYKFGFPVVEGREVEEATLPLAFRRYLRPGDYTLVVKLEDLNAGRALRREIPLTVPAMEQAAPVDPGVDRQSAELFREASAALTVDGEGASIKILPPGSDLLTGFVRFDTLTSGADIAKVSFALDGRHLMVKNRPPYNVEIDLGPFPRPHSLEVQALGVEGKVLGTDTLLINSGSNRFSIEIKEPRPGVKYDRSLLARAEVEVPEGRALERVEFYLNETLAATLYQPPFSQPLSLVATVDGLNFVRAVAYLPDGHSAEDIVFVNAPSGLDSVDVQFVELFVSALDRSGRPVRGLQMEDFEVFESGIRQEISRFETVGDLPIHIGVLLDNSGSMRGALDQARAAALRFFREAITPKDRAAVITFNRFPTLAVKLTSDLAQLGGGLAGLTAEGETALYDSVMFGLYYFAGIKGQRALLLLSDGRDEASRFSFEETLAYARRAGVTLYAIGLNLHESGARAALSKLADETGGRSFFLSDVTGLDEVYQQIQQDLRTQYLLAYQSSQTSGTDEFRSIEVRVRVKGIDVKTLSGYFP